MTPTAIKLHKVSNELELEYVGDVHYRLQAEYLRVLSPSAEVRGHGGGGGELPAGKIDVSLTEIHAVGHYGVQLVFDDGHDSGIYSWQYLRDLCVNQHALWQDYLDRLRIAGLTRDPHVQTLKL